MKILLLSFIFLFVYGNANAQFGGVRRAAEHGVERAVEKKVEQETEKAVTKAIDKAADDAEQRAIEADKALDDASTKVRIGFINCTATMTEGTCIAIEDVTVEAGTFRCHKISQKINATAAGVKNESTTVTWYAKGVGAVKTETYDKKGNLQSVQELVSK